MALALGRVLELVLAQIGMTEGIAALDPPAILLIALTVLGMTLASLAGIHQVVTMTVVLVLLAPLQSGLSDLVLMESALVGWAFASMVGVSAVSVATTGSMFRVPMEQLVIGPNLKFVAAYGLATILVLGAVNLVLTVQAWCAQRRYAGAAHPAHPDILAADASGRPHPRYVQVRPHRAKGLRLPRDPPWRAPLSARRAAIARPFRRDRCRTGA